MNLAYLTSQYPKVSHTFIRREILELERQGHSVLRLAVRQPDDEVVDATDIEEDGKTLHCLAQPISVLLGAVVSAFLSRPKLFLSTFARAVGMGFQGSAGLLRFIIYFVEACFFLRVLESHGVEHVHVHFGTNPASVAYLVKRLGGPGYSMTIHGPDELDDPAGYLLGRKIGASEFTVAISHYTGAQLRRWVDYREWSKIKVVRCVVDGSFLDGFSSIPTGPRVFLCIGRLTAQKGQLLLLDAFAKLVEDRFDAELVFAGDGEMREVLEGRIADRGLGDRVRITGWIGEAEVRKQLGDSAVLLLPSFAEGLPVVIMEAMAMGRPVISTYIAGIPELVRAGENGWLVPAGDMESLVDTMREACSIPAEELEEMGRCGRERVARQHDTKTEVQRLAGFIANRDDSGAL